MAFKTLSLTQTWW